MGEQLHRFRADLHVHTVLSPCASIEMIPPLIVRRAIENGIDWIAITDHNATANVHSVMQAAKGSKLTVTPGVELQTREEVHVLALFDTLEQVNEMQKVIDQHLPDIANDIDFFGEQFIVDDTGDFISREERMLISSLNLGFSDVSRMVYALDGLFIPAHVNRKANGLFQTLGFIPKEDHIDALEISRHISPHEAEVKYPQCRGVPIIQNGDVHNLDDYLGSTYWRIEKPTISEMRQAFMYQNNRGFEIQGN